MQFSNTLHKQLSITLLLLMTVMLSGCLHKIITVPVKVAYKTTKYAVKGTVAVAEAVIPGDSSSESNADKDK